MFCDHLIDLEWLVTEAQQCGIVVVLGDFNAHLGHLGGVRGSSGSPNPHGLLVKEWADRCSFMQLLCRPYLKDQTTHTSVVRGE